MFLKCIVLSFLLSLCTATTVRKGGGIGKSTSFYCSNVNNNLYNWSISNGKSPPYLTNVQQNGDELRIISIDYNHEGNYTCNGETSQLIVLAVVKFQGEHCSPYENCDLGVTSFLPEGQPIPLNISYDFVNGGPRGENQAVEFMRFKQDGSVLLSCSNTGCSIPSNVQDKVSSSGSNINNIQANVTDDRPINASRAFVVELDILIDSNLYETRKATFTVNVTSTSKVLPTSSSMVPPDDTTSSSVAVPMTSTVLIDPPPTSTALIPSPSPTTSSGSSSTSESVLSPPPSSSDKFEASSSSSSSPSSSSSSFVSPSSSTTITDLPVPTSILDNPEDHVVLASILSAFIITIIVIVIFLSVPFLILYNSKRSTSVSSDINNSQDPLDRPPEIVIDRSTRTEMTSTVIYDEVKTMNDDMHSHNVIKNIHYVSNGSSSSSITDGQSYVDPPYQIPAVVRELVPDFNSDWTPAV